MKYVYLHGKNCTCPYPSWSCLYARFSTQHFVHFLFQLPASYLRTFVGYCFFYEINRFKMHRTFHLEKLWPTDRNRCAFRAGLPTSPSSFRVSKIVFLPFSASFVPIEHCTDRFRDTNFPFFLLDATLSTQIEEGPGILKFPAAAMFVYNSHTRFIARDIARFSRG